MSDSTGSFLVQLKEVCGGIARGDYQSVDTLFEMTGIETADLVLQDLAESFGNMVVQVEAREFHLGKMLDELKEANRQLDEARRRLSAENVQLRDQVQRMRIEIDQTQKEREVSDIVETDYFQTLKTRAHDMRERHRARRRD